MKYYGAYPSGFLERARALLGVACDDPVLHVCAGRVKEYPYRGFGMNDKTLDLDPACSPDFLHDARFPFPNRPGGWAAILIDRPYTLEDAAHYGPGPMFFPVTIDLLRHGVAAVRKNGRIGMLDYVIPRPPPRARFVACVGVVMGFGNRGRFYTVFERSWHDSGTAPTP